MTRRFTLIVEVDDDEIEQESPNVRMKAELDPLMNPGDHSNAHQFGLTVLGLISQFMLPGDKKEEKVGRIIIN